MKKTCNFPLSSLLLCHSIAKLDIFIYFSSQVPRARDIDIACVA